LERWDRETGGANRLPIVPDGVVYTPGGVVFDSRHPGPVHVDDDTSVFSFETEPQPSATLFVRILDTCSCSSSVNAVGINSDAVEDTQNVRDGKPPPIE